MVYTVNYYTFCFFHIFNLLYTTYLLHVCPSFYGVQEIKLISVYSN